MSLWRSALFLLLGLGLGFLLSQILRPSSQTVPTKTAMPVQSDNSAPNEFKNLRPAKEQQNLSAELSKLPVATYKKGEQSLEGTVFTKGGQPVAGVLISAVIYGATPDTTPQTPHDLSLMDYIRQEAAQYHYDRSMLVQAITDSQGKFLLEGFQANHHYRFHASKENWAIATDKQYLHINHIEALRFIAYAAAPVAVEIIGSPPVAEGTLVACMSSSKNIDPNNIYKIPWQRYSPTVLIPIQYSFLYFIGPNEEEGSEPVPIQLSQGQAATIVIQLQPKYRISGKILIDEMDPTPYFELYLESLSRSNSEGGNESYLAATVFSTHPQFSLPLEYSGQYRLLCKSPYSEEQTSQMIHLVENLIDIEIDTPQCAATQTIDLTVLNSDGLPLEECKFSISYWHKRYGQTHTTVVARRLDQGRHLLGLHLPSQLNGKVTVLTVQVNQYGSRQFELPHNEHVSILCQFEQPAYLEVTIQNFADNLTVGEVDIHATSQNHSSTMVSATLDHPTAQLGPLPPGETTIRLEIMPSGEDPSWHDDRQPVGSLTLNTHSGINKILMDIDGLSTLEIIFPQKLAQKNGSLTRLGKSSSQREFTVTKDGKAYFANISYGQYLLNCSAGFGSSSELFEFDFNGQSKIRFIAQEANAILVLNGGSKETIFGGAFLCQDLIVATNNTPITSNREAQIIIDMICQNNSQTLTILREGQRIEVDFPRHPTPKNNQVYDLLHPTTR